MVISSLNLKDIKTEITGIESEIKTARFMQVPHLNQRIEDLKSKLDIHTTRIIDRNGRLHSSAVQIHRFDKSGLEMQGILSILNEKFEEQKGIYQGVLQKEISCIYKELKLVKNEVKKIKADTHRDWKKKFKKIGLESDQSKLESEVALILEKADISEEVDRLGIHLKEFSKIMNAQTLIISESAAKNF